MNHLHE